MNWWKIRALKVVAWKIGLRKNFAFEAFAEEDFAARSWGLATQLACEETDSKHQGPELIRW